MVGKVSESKQVIRFWNLGDIKKVSSWCKMNNIETVIGHFLFLVGVNGKSNVLDWSSNKLQIPSASPLAVESEAALDLYGQVCRSHDSEHAADQQHSQGFCDD